MGCSGSSSDDSNNKKKGLKGANNLNTNAEAKKENKIKNQEDEKKLLEENEYPQVKEHKRVYLTLINSIVPSFVIEKKVDGWMHTGFVKEVEESLTRHGAGLWESQDYQGEDMYSDGKIHGYSIFFGNKDEKDLFRRYMNNGKIHGLRVYEHTTNSGAVIKKYSMYINGNEIAPNLTVDMIHKINNDDITWVHDYKVENPDSKIENFKNFFKSSFHIQKSKPPLEYILMMAELKFRLNKIQKTKKENQDIITFSKNFLSNEAKNFK